MKTLGKINTLGKVITLGKVNSLCRGAVYPSEEGAGGGPLYKRILNSMPSDLRESLVAWYSPNLQGLTNAELADSLNEYVDGLHDLSGNGNHMTLYNFSGVGPESDENGNGGGYVNADGDLGFDGVDDEAVGTIADVAVVVTADGQSAVDSEDITLGVNDSGSHIVMTLVERIYFDRELNEEELSWVLANMTGENAHVDTKYNQVTLYCGDFDEDGTLIDEDIDVFTFSVQHGNSLWDADSNLLSKYHKDIDATHCTSDVWYDTDGLEYAGEAITEDCTFYCERQRVSDYMLEQLDGVTLSDGSTAKEHLVAMYYPKYQGLTKSDVLGGTKLQDLSGNGMDVALYNFTDEQQIIKSNGDICFAEGTYGYIKLSATKVLSSFTLVSKATPIKQSAHIMVRFGNNNHAISRQSNSIWNFGKENDTGYVNGLLSFTPSKAYYNDNEYAIESGANKAISEIIFNKYSTSSSNLGNSEYTSVLLFDVGMTKEQIDKIYTILKLN